MITDQIRSTVYLIDPAEHRHTIKDGGTGTLTNREAS